jgi:hypothetical protein
MKVLAIEMTVWGVRTKGVAIVRLAGCEGSLGSYRRDFSRQASIVSCTINATHDQNEISLR